MDAAVLGILSVYQRLMWYHFVLQNGIIGKWAPRRSLGHYRSDWEVSWILTSSFPAMR